MITEQGMWTHFKGSRTKLLLTTFCDFLTRHLKKTVISHVVFEIGKKPVKYVFSNTGRSSSVQCCRLAGRHQRALGNGRRRGVGMAAGHQHGDCGEVEQETLLHARSRRRLQRSDLQHFGGRRGTAARQQKIRQNSRPLPSHSTALHRRFTSKSRDFAARSGW